MIVFAAFHVLPIAAVALVAAIFVVLTRCLDIEKARGAIQWRILYMIFGMLALGAAMEKTGAAHLIASGATGAISGRITLSVIYLLATVLTELISNNAVALLISPIAFADRGDAAESMRDHLPLRSCLVVPRVLPRPSDIKPTPTCLARAVIASPISRKSACPSTSSSES